MDTNNNTATDSQQSKCQIVSTDQVDVTTNGHHSNGQKAPEKFWDPKASAWNLQPTQLTEFQNLISTKYNLKLESYNDLYNWSVENHLKFWEEFWHFAKIIHSKPYDKVFDKESQSIDNIPFKWFEGALLNYAENLLKFNDDKVALYSFGEAFTTIKSITFKQLRDRVRLYQLALRKMGIKKGDRVAGYLPNCIECVEAKLATLSLGAIWSCTSPDFGSISVVDRFQQIKPKVLFSIQSVAYNGKIHDHVGKLKEVIDGLPTVEKVVIVPFNDNEKPFDFSSVKNSTSLENFLSESVNDPTELSFEQVPFYHPMVILFSSGTTGTPKCIVHSHGGTLIQHLKEHLLQGNMLKSDVIFYYTTTGWMMYDWLLSSLAVGATVVLYDGSPVLPHINVLWDLTDKLGVTLFGTSAKWLSVIEEKKCEPKNTHKLTTLKAIYSTGSPLKPESFSYVYRSIKSDVLLGSITGGSDIISLFCGHNVNLPVYKGEIQSRHLGMAVECWNLSGKPVYDECGELVCTKPFPSMPVYFYGDEKLEKYRSSYFEKFPGVWAHGDFCMISGETGGVTMLGRSDGTLNPNGVRFGSADIYNVIEHMEEIEDSLCVGQHNPNEPTDERVVLFVKLHNDLTLDKALKDKIKTRIRGELSARHVPSVILQISDIPYTLNGKKVEVPVRRVIEGHIILPSSSLVNPNSLEQFKHMPELKQW